MPGGHLACQAIIADAGSMSFTPIGEPVDYARWTQNLLAFAHVAKEHDKSDLFLKAVPFRDDERKALSLIQAGILGGERAIQSRLLELERPLADGSWKRVFNHSSLFWSTVKPRHAGETYTQEVSESSTTQLIKPLTDTSSPTRMDSKPQGSDEVDSKLPKKLRKDSPSRVKARSAYDYAMVRISNANEMTAAELFDAIIEDGEAKAMLPPSAESFTKYLNECGIRLRKGDSKTAGSSVVRFVVCTWRMLTVASRDGVCLALDHRDNHAPSNCKNRCDY